MVQVVLYDRPMQPLVEWIHLGAAVMLAFLIRRAERRDNEQSLNWANVVCFVILIALPFVGDFVQRRVSYYGRPFEIQMVLALRNMMFGLAVSKHDVRKRSYASLASCFVALYSLLWLMNHWNIALVFMYTLAGICLLYTSPSPRDATLSRMPSSA